MFGIKDFFVLLPYILGFICLIFSAWYGVSNWNKD